MSLSRRWRTNLATIGHTLYDIKIHISTFGYEGGLDLSVVDKERLFGECVDRRVVGPQVVFVIDVDTGGLPN